jgi:ActR/RegA family two-component response regulator
MLFMPTESKPSAVGLLLCDDLIFASRIVGTARNLDMTVKQAKTADQLVALAGRERPQCVIIDLSNDTLVIDKLMQQLRDCCAPMPRVVAYGSHVNTGTLQIARQAGCAPVLARSKFVEDLPKLLPQWMLLSPAD